jgi:hypothetical protein
LLSPFPDIVTKTSFITSSPHHVTLKTLLFPLFLKHWIINSWTAASSSVTFVSSHLLPTACLQTKHTFIFTYLCMTASLLLWTRQRLYNNVSESDISQNTNLYGSNMTEQNWTPLRPLVCKLPSGSLHEIFGHKILQVSLSFNPALGLFCIITLHVQ